MSKINFICMKYGSQYGADYPNRLYAGLLRNTSSDLRLICVTDDAEGIRPEIEVLPLVKEPFHDAMFAEMDRRGWKSPFRKVSMYRPGLVKDLDGPLIMIDIDTVIVDNVDELRDYAPGKVAMRMDWKRGGRSNEFGHGSVEKFEPDLHGYIYEEMARDPIGALGRSFGREQIYTSTTADRAGDFVAFPDEWIVSFKYDCRPARPLNLFVEPRLPPKAKVVCFHGRPKMEEAVYGYKADFLRSTRPCSWMQKAWLGQDA